MTSPFEQRRRMTEAPVPRLIARLAAPTVASMLVTNLYNAGDAWFVSRLGTPQAGAIGIVFAMMAVFQAFGFLFGHGAGSHVARLLGAGDADRAKVYASVSFFLSLAFGALCAVAGLLLLGPLARAFGSTDTILPHAKDYLRWVLLSGPFFTASCVMNNVLRYEGRALLAMVGLLSGALLNLALDPLLIFGLGWGVTGAGVSTAVAQTVSFLLLLGAFRSGRTACEFRLGLALRGRALVGRILAVGSPSLVRNVLGAIGPVLLNHQAAPWGDAAIAAMAIVGRVSFLVMAVAIGIGQGFQPVAGFNYGAGLYGRVREGFRFTVRAGCAVMLPLAAACVLGAEGVVRAFRDDPEVVAVGAFALRWQALSCLLHPATMTTNMLFQSIGLAGRAAFLSALRSGVFFFPLVLTLPALAGVRGVALAQPVADALSFAVAMPFLAHFLRRMPRADAPVPAAGAGGGAPATGCAPRPSSRPVR